MYDGSLSISQYNGRSKHKAQDLSIHDVLEKFSLVTKFARDTTSQIFGDNHGNGFRSERRSHNQPSVDYRRKASNLEEEIPDEIPVPSDPLEVTFDVPYDP